MMMALIFLMTQYWYFISTAYQRVLAIVYLAICWLNILVSFPACEIVSFVWKLNETNFMFWKNVCCYFHERGRASMRKYCLRKQGQLLFAINIVDLGSWPIKTVSLLKIPLLRLSRLTPRGCFAQMPWDYVTSFMSSPIRNNLRILIIWRENLTPYQ